MGNNSDVRRLSNVYLQLLEAIRLTRLSRFVLVTATVGIVAAGALAFLDQRTVRLESKGGRREYRRVDHDGSVRLVRRVSGSPCVYGRSWGYDRNGIWVDNGCGAIFEVGDDRRGNDRWDNDRRDNDRWDNRRDDDRWGNHRGGMNNAVRTVRLKSQDKRYKSTRVNTSGGVRLVRQVSDSPCIQGRSWGYDRDKIWVDRGCEAVFEVGRGGYSYGNDRDRDRRGDDNWRDWLPGRYTGRHDGRDITVVIDRDGRGSMRRFNNGRWDDDNRGYYRDNSLHFGDLRFAIERSGGDIRLRCNNGWNLRRL